MQLSKYVACICEGGAEKNIIELLLDANRLMFTYDDLLEGEVLPCRSADSFEKQYLRKGFTEAITVLRILDSRGEKFNLSKAYVHKIKKVINVITAPEIEILVILNENRYDDYSKFKSKKKPSLYCKENLGFHDVKSKNFMKGYFSNIDALVAAIKEYKRVSYVQRNELTLADLLK